MSAAAPGKGRRGAIARNGLLMATAQYLCVGIGFGTAVAAARLLGADGYGRAALVLAFPSLVWSFVSLKPGTAVTRYLAIARAGGRHAEAAAVCRLGFGIDLATSLLALLLAGVTSAWVAARVYHLPGTGWLMVAYGASFPFLSLMGTSTAVLNTWLRFRALAGVQLFERLVTLVLVVGALAWRPGVGAFVLATAAAQVLTGAASLWSAHRVLAGAGLPGWWRRGEPLPAALRREIFSFFGWNYLLVSLAGAVAQLPLMLLGRFRGPAEAGFYRLALTLVTAGSYLENALARVVYPLLCARWAEAERRPLGRELRQWTLRLGVPAAAGLVAGTLFLPWLVPLVFGPQFAGAARGVQWMMVGTVVGTVFFWQSSYFQAAGKMSVLTRANAAYSAVIVALVALLAGPWGFAGAAVVIGLARAGYSAVLLAAMPRGAAPRGSGAAPAVRLPGAVEAAT
ncbi:MAG: lipopolysaccharide biosynthesis protein [Longimicrobiaceae bacterium]